MRVSGIKGKEREWHLKKRELMEKRKVKKLVIISELHTQIASE